MLMDIPSPNNLHNKNQPVIGIVEWFRPGEHDRVEKAVAALKELKISELRTGISWAEYSTPAGKEWYQWLIPTLAQAVNVLPCFQHTSPALGLVPRSTSALTNPTEVADLMEQVISELGSYFDWIELGNDSHHKATNNLTQPNYWPQLTEMVSTAAKAAHNKGKKVVLGGINSVNANWLQFLLSQETKQLIDAVGIQGFPDVYDQTWQGWEENIAPIQKILKNNNSGTAMPRVSHNHRYNLAIPSCTEFLGYQPVAFLNFRISDT